MITKQEFDFTAKTVVSNLAVVLPKMISYKSYIQKAILDIATNRELEDVRNCCINQGMIDKLCRLAKNEWLLSADAQSLTAQQWLWLQLSRNMTGEHSTS